MKVIKEGNNFKLSIVKKERIDDYYKKRKIIDNQLKELSKLLKKHENEFKKDYNNYTFIGDMGKLESELEDIINYLKS